MCSEFRGVLTCLSTDIAKTAVASQAKKLEIIGDSINFNLINEKFPSIVSISCSASAVNCVGTPAAFSTCVCSSSVASVQIFSSTVMPLSNHSIAAAAMGNTTMDCATLALDIVGSKATCIVGHLGGPVWSALWLFLLTLAAVLLLTKGLLMCRRWCKNRRAAYLPIIPEPIIMVSKNIFIIFIICLFLTAYYFYELFALF